MKTIMQDDKNNLTIDEAIDVLPEGEEIHVFHNQGNTLLGFDVSRERVIQAIKDAGFLQIAGAQAMGMGHGLAVIPKNAKYQSEIWFVKHDPAKMKVYDAQTEEGEEPKAEEHRYWCNICDGKFKATEAVCPACESKDVMLDEIEIKRPKNAV